MRAFGRQKSTIERSLRVQHRRAMSNYYGAESKLQ